MKVGHAVRRERRRYSPGFYLIRVPNIGVNGIHLWLEAVPWGTECFTGSTAKALTGRRWSDKELFRRLLDFRVMPVFQ